MKELMPLLIIHFLWPIITAMVAKHLGRKFWPWFIVGALLPCLGLVILFLMPGKKTKVSLLKVVKAGGIPDQPLSEIRRLEIDGN